MLLKWISVVTLLLILGASGTIALLHSSESESGNALKRQSKRDVYLGAWVEDFWDSKSKSLRADKLLTFEEVIGRKVALANIYSEWTYLEEKELVGRLHAISSHGWTPMVSSNPFFFDRCPESDAPLYRTIARGDCDKFLQNAARNLRSYGKPMFFRFAWEMNLPDMYWSIPYTKSTPNDFQDAWRHLYSIFNAEKADNVIWVLSFNTSHGKTVPYAELYPGDEYVDWVAIDGYNWGDSHEWSGWTDFNGVFRNSYTELIALTDKPVMLSEVNSAESGGDKAAWLSDMLVKQIPVAFPQVHAVMFFNENKSEGESVDWRIEKSEKYVNSVKDAFKKAGLYKSSYP